MSTGRLVAPSPSRLVALALTVILTAAASRADTVSIISGQGTLDFPDVQITGATGGKLSFRASTGRANDRDFAQVARIRLDDDLTVNQAEDAFTAGQWANAVELYQRALATPTEKDKGEAAEAWLKVWCAQRLVAAGEKANRFDAAAEGYIALLLADPTSATNLRPALPDAKSPYLATALSAVKQALTTPRLSSLQQQTLMSFQLDLERAGGDEKAADATLEKMLQAGGQGGAAASTPAATDELARMKLQQASLALDKNDFAGAAATIQSNSSIFRGPRAQAQALYLLAEAQAGEARQKNDPAGQGAWEDAALAYMRVVAHFKSAPGAPFVAMSLVKTAQIEERLGHADAARALYQQVILEYPKDSAAATAQAGERRLSGK